MLARSWNVVASVVLVAAPFAAPPASGQAVVTRVTGPQPWRAASNASNWFWGPDRNEMSISRDGGWIAFESSARNLTPYDRNDYSDIYLFEVATGRMLGLTSNNGLTPNGASCDPALSGDGRYVVFSSYASNLVPNDNNGYLDVFRVDRDPDGNGIFDEQPWTFTCISVDSSGNQSIGFSYGPSISDDGMRVVFINDGGDLCPGDTNGSPDAFLYDVASATTTRVDVDSGGNQCDFGCEFADLSADGNVVAISSSSDDLVKSDTNGVEDVFVRDLTTGITERVSLTDQGKQANGASTLYRRCQSTDGWVVAFESDATNLVSGDVNGLRDVFVRDRAKPATTLVSVSSKGAQGKDVSTGPTISADGTRVTFVSLADNLAGKDGNGARDVFLRDLKAGATSLVSTSTGGTSADGESGAATISSDGRLVVFWSVADDVVKANDYDGFRDVFLADLPAGTTRYVSAVPAGDPNAPAMSNAYDFYGGPTRPVMSSDGRYVAFESDATNLVDNDDNGYQDVFVADRKTGAIVRASVSYFGGDANETSWGAAISATGRFVAYVSAATNLVPFDANGTTHDVFLRDRDPDGNGIFDEGNATTTLVSVDSNGIQANDWSYLPSISADGTKIAFPSGATNLDPADPTYNGDIFVRDTTTGRTWSVSGSSQNYDYCQLPSISADGSTVSYEYNWYDALWTFHQAVIVDGPSVGHQVFEFSIPPNQGTTAATPCLSSDGSRLAYSLVDYPTAQSWVGVLDVSSGRDARMLPFPDLAEATLNPSGRQSTFYSPTAYVGNDANGMHDVYLLDVQQDEGGAVSGLSDPILVSVGTSGFAGNGNSYVSVPSDDGNLVAFASDASDLVAGDVNGCRDIFVYDRWTVARSSLYGSGWGGPHAIPSLTVDVPPVLGGTIHLQIGNTSGVASNAIVFVGVNDASVTLPWGATLLVDLSTAIHFVVPVGIAGSSLPGTVPNNPAFTGLDVYLQALVFDNAVVHKLDFTNGLDLRFGH